MTEILSVNSINGGCKGHFLLATPSMPDKRFAGAVIYIISHDEQGAMGFILNKPLLELKFTDILLELELVKAEHITTLNPKLQALPIYHGGYVDETRGFILHSSDLIFEGISEKISDKLYMSTSLDVLKTFAEGIMPAKTMLCLGYVGWSQGQLEEELALDGWLLLPAHDDDVLTIPFDKLYTTLIKRLGVIEGALSTTSGRA